MRPTRLLYLQDGKTLTGTATLLSVEASNGKNALIMDRTHFYPQGGGQPTDTGVIHLDDGEFTVEAVHREPTGQVRHEGIFDGEPIAAVDRTVSYQIDAERRHLHNRLHSAGHVLDIVLFDVMGLSSQLKVSKAYHYPQGPSIEYFGHLLLDDKKSWMKTVEDHCNDLIGRKLNVEIGIEDQLIEDPTYCDDDRHVRFMKIEGFERKILCGGTHVEHLGELGKMIIRKVEKRGDTTRIAYNVI